MDYGQLLALAVDRHWQGTDGVIVALREEQGEAAAQAIGKIADCGQDDHGCLKRLVVWFRL